MPPSGCSYAGIGIPWGNIAVRKPCSWPSWTCASPITNPWCKSMLTHVDGSGLWADVAHCTADHIYLLGPICSSPSLPFLIPMLLSAKLAISSTCSALCWSSWTGTRFLAIAGKYYTIANCFMALLQWPALVLHGLRYVEAEQDCAPSIVVQMLKCYGWKMRES